MSNTDRTDAHVHRLRRQARQVPMLDADTEQELVRRFHRGSSESLNRLVQCHMRLVVSIAEEHARQGVSVDDLIGEGSLGLVEAAQRFDPERGTRFGTYAAWWVRAYIRRYTLANRRIVRPPSTRNARRVLWGLRRAQREISQRAGRPATHEEVAEMLNVTPHEVAAVDSALGGRDVPVGPVDGETGFDPMEDQPTPEDRFADTERHELDTDRISSALQRLSERERKIVESRLLDDETSTLASLGAKLGVSRERVRQLQKRAERKLRESLREAA